MTVPTLTLSADKPGHLEALYELIKKLPDGPEKREAERISYEFYEFRTDRERFMHRQKVEKCIIQIKKYMGLDEYAGSHLKGDNFFYNSTISQHPDSVVEDACRFLGVPYGPTSGGSV